MENAVKTARGRYEQLATERDPFLQRARDAAKVTIPALMPPTTDYSGSQKLYTPYQSVGSRGVNNLAAKLLLALLPPGQPFFRLAVDDFLLNELMDEAGGGQDGKDARGLFEKAMGTVEKAVMTRLEQMHLRRTTFELFRHLIATGNGLLYFRDDATKKNRGKGARLFRLDEYVCKRDVAGQPMEIIVEQQLSPTAAPPEVLALVDAANLERDERATERTIPLYTWIRREGKLWYIHQEVEGEMVPGSEGTETLERVSWHPLRFNQISSEDYGRGHVEEYIGDLISLEALSQALVEGSVAAAKLIFMVEEGSTTTRKKLAEADNLDVISGNARDVTVLQSEKVHDFQVAKGQADSLERRLSAVFLLSSGLPRDAERVTAEEIRLIAAELEDVLGGAYSLFAQEFQLPLVKKIMADMQAVQRLPKLPQDKIVPEIVTGLEALGRIRDLQKLDVLTRGVGDMFGQDAVAKWINVGAWIRRRGVALGIDIDGVIRSNEEVAKIEEQEQQRAMADKLAPEAMKQMGGGGAAATQPTQ